MANTSTIHIKTDFDCIVYDYDQELGTTKADTFCNFELRKGEHELSFAFTEDESISKTVNYNIEDTDRDYRLIVEIVQNICDKAKEYYNSKNYSAAYSIFMPTANKGIAEALYYLGLFHKNGYFVKKDEKEAIN